MEHAPRFHVLGHAPQRGRCRKGRASPERQLSQQLQKSFRGRPAASSRPNFTSYVSSGLLPLLLFYRSVVPRIVRAPSPLCCGDSASRLRPLLGPSHFSCMPSAFAPLLFCCLDCAFLLASLAAFLLLPSVYPLPFCVVFAPFFLLVSAFLESLEPQQPIGVHCEPLCLKYLTMCIEITWCFQSPGSISRGLRDRHAGTEGALPSADGTKLRGNSFKTPESPLVLACISIIHSFDH